MLAFEKNFWKEKIGESDYFGRIPEAEKDRGLACLFYDVSAKVNIQRNNFLAFLFSVRKMFMFILEANSALVLFGIFNL